MTYLHAYAYFLRLPNVLEKTSNPIAIHSVRCSEEIPIKKSCSERAMNSLESSAFARAQRE